MIGIISNENVIWVLEKEFGNTKPYAYSFFNHNMPEKDEFMILPWMRNPSTSMRLHRGEFLRGRRAEAWMKFRAGRRVLSSFMK